MEIVYLLIGIIIGGTFFGLLLKSKSGKIESEKSYLLENLQNLKIEFEEEKEKSENLNLKILELTGEKGKAESKNTVLEKTLEEIHNDLSNLTNKHNEYLTFNSQLKTENKNLIEKLENQKTEIEKMQEKFTIAFENLANKIFEEKSEKFTAKNKENLDEILNPLKNDLDKFKSKIENTDEKNRLSNATLIQQIKGLKELNSQLSDDAGNLTKALKGDFKIQGDWGETVLRRILEESGLTEGIEYVAQGKGMDLKDDESRRFKPDFVIKLPEEKHIVVDSKVSLVSYEKFMNEADTQHKKEVYQKALHTSIKSHIDDLNSKHYQKLSGLNSPDFVLLFMPIEGSFNLVVQTKSELYQYGLDKKIVLVSPSSLLVTLRTIAYIWRQEKQNKNAITIARQAGDLYDKFVGFLTDLDNIGKNIDRSKDSYLNALNKLKSGRGNLITRVENIRKLGAKASKEIPEKFIEEDIPELVE
ncbi:MAG: DNA recombination protein RmuC [Candidatus Cloacimonetes bacterium]|nr:DNA recombination protein RmuC [Candidatus Cloacimonadota bacterium]